MRLRVTADAYAYDDRVFALCRPSHERATPRDWLRRARLDSSGSLGSGIAVVGCGRCQFVPPLAGSAERHVFIDRVGNVDFFHYDPYAQLLSRIVRGFRKDLIDAEHLVRSGMVDAERFRELVNEIRESAYARYPNLSRDSVVAAVDEVLARFE